MTRLLVALAVLVACKERRVDQEAPARERVATTTEPVAPPPIPSCKAGERVCSGDDVVQCDPDGTLGKTLETCKGVCKAGACIDTCAVRDVELIYVVDNRNNLYSFDPNKLPQDPFRRIGSLTCDSTSTPNSMAVDRLGIAWLGYQNGKLYRASIFDARCSPSGDAPTGAPRTFGMGFVTDGPKATTEQLFVAGGVDDPERSLAVLDLTKAPAVWRRIATINSSIDHPELTGTGDGKLFAYFPGPGRGFVQELDRKSGALRGTKWSLDPNAGRIEAYAFAHWGGTFWVFTTADTSSTIHAIHMKTGKVELVREKLPFEIVGAGVSTCAPLLERTP